MLVFVVSCAGVNGYGITTRDVCVIIPGLPAILFDSHQSAAGSAEAQMMSD